MKSSSLELIILYLFSLLQYLRTKKNYLEGEGEGESEVESEGGIKVKSLTSATN